VQLVVTFALDTEFAPWRRRHPFRPLADAGGPCPVYDWRIGDLAVRVLLTGVGGARVLAAAPALERSRPDICIAAGLGGGLVPGLRRGTVVVAREVLDGRGRAFQGDAALAARAEACGARPVGALVSADRVLVRAGEKAVMAATADVVDMETFSIFSVADRIRVPALAVRAISDEAGEDLPFDFNRLLDAQGRLRYGRLAAQLASRPHRLGRLVRLGRASARAADALARFLDRYVERLAAGKDTPAAMEAMAG
jgi:adenosylhomocysteine nucleosidase